MSIDGRTLTFRVEVRDERERVGEGTHTVQPLGKNRCLLRFGVPILVFPYVIVCLIVIRRIAELAEAG